MKIQFKQEITSAEKVTNDDIIQFLLKNRQVLESKDFLKPESPLSMSLKTFGYDKEITKALGVLKKIKEDGKAVVVYTDYDADGITGGSIVWETLHLLGFKVMPYVPHRQLEGYGFSKKGIDNVKKEFDPALIISVDHGIAAREQIAYAHSLGIQVIVTDHHHKPELIPEDAEVIFHIPALSGSGVGYFFAKEVFNAFKKECKNTEKLEQMFATDYLALASVGTIADLVPLVGPSRSVVTYGLAAFPQVKRAGIKHLFKEAGIEGKTITPYEVGFIIAPRINAVGRLEHAIDALRLLCTTSDERASELASKVGVKNTERQDMVKESVEQALTQLEEMEKAGPLPKLIILHSKDWHEGIIGLIASKVVEKYYRPTIIMTEGDGQLKGSARSIYSFHITDFFASLKEYFLNYGGHRQAAGFTISKAKLDEFIKVATEKAAGMISDSDLVRVVEVDLKIPVSLATLSLAKKIEKLAPFGVGNSHPTFVSDVRLVDAQLFGKTHTHLKLFVNDQDKTSFPLELIAFGKADLISSLSRDKNMQIVYQLEVNRWNGKESLRGKLVEIVM